MRRRGFRLLLVLIATLLALTPLIITLYQEWEAVRQSFIQIKWTWYLLAQSLLIPIMFILSIVPWVSLRTLLAPLPILRSSASYFVSQIAKYFPGGIWAIPGRMVIYEVQGVHRTIAVVSVLRETTAFYLGAASLAIIGFLLGNPEAGEIRFLLSLGLLGSVIIILLTHTPWVWSFLDRLRVSGVSRLENYRSLSEGGTRLDWLPKTFLISFAFWILLGLPFSLLIQAVAVKPPNLTWFEAGSIFAAAWCIGFVVIFVPAGIGVRESVLVYMLNQSLPLNEALNIALIARLWWILAEAFWIVLALLWFLREEDLLRKILSISREES